MVWCMSDDKGEVKSVPADPDAQVLWSWEFQTYNSHGGLYIASLREIEAIHGARFWPGEIDGKHSDPEVDINRGDFSLVSEDPVVVDALGEHIWRCNDVDLWGSLLDQEYLTREEGIGYVLSADCPTWL